MKSGRRLRIIWIGIAFIWLIVLLIIKTRETKPAQKSIHVAAYSAFLNSWGPGPEIARKFEEKTGLHVDYLDAGDAGLLLKKLELFPADAVVGFDSITVVQALAKMKWKPLTSDVPSDAHLPQFLAFDQGPMTFVYRKGEVEPPRDLNALLDPIYAKSIALEDPRSSTPGLQFLFWILDQKGDDDGFAYLAKLKPSLALVAPSWSETYGAFTKGRAKLAFSYLTSPVYHWINEKKFDYQPVLLAEGIPMQVEYAGVPDSCENCDGGIQFAQFLLSDDSQKTIMMKNYMLPISPKVMTGTPFADLPSAKLYQWKRLPELIEKRDAILERWRKLEL